MASPDADLGEHPGPPADLAERSLPLAKVTSPLSRIYPLKDNPVYFGKRARGRWDDPERHYGVLYAAEMPIGAFAERLLVRPGMLAQGLWISGKNAPVSGGDLRSFGLCELTLTSTLQCVDLRGPGLAAIGADARLTAGPHRVSQQWARFLFNHPEQPAGIIWRSRADPEQFAVALHERTRPFLHGASRGSLTHPGNAAILEAITQRYNLVILPASF